jgi:nicotinamidase-related amidase
MEALLVVDAQNEFSPEGRRPIPNHGSALEAIRSRVEEARCQRHPIAWIRHHNKPHESPAFVPDSWGAAFSSGLGPKTGNGPEREFVKEVYGAFTGTGLDVWLRTVGADAVLIVGFYAHGCVSTSVREALIRGLEVSIDPIATGSGDIEDEVLGRQTADEVRRSAMLHVVGMGARVASPVRP